MSVFTATALQQQVPQLLYVVNKNTQPQAGFKTSTYFSNGDSYQHIVGVLDTEIFLYDSEQWVTVDLPYTALPAPPLPSYYYKHHAVRTEYVKALDKHVTVLVQYLDSSMSGYDAAHTGRISVMASSNRVDYTLLAEYDVELLPDTVSIKILYNTVVIETAAVGHTINLLDLSIRETIPGFSYFLVESNTPGHLCRVDLSYATGSPAYSVCFSNTFGQTWTEPYLLSTAQVNGAFRGVVGFFNGAWFMYTNAGLLRFAGALPAGAPTVTASFAGWSYVPTASLFFIAGGKLWAYIGNSYACVSNDGVSFSYIADSASNFPSHISGALNVLRNPYTNDVYLHSQRWLASDRRIVKIAANGDKTYLTGANDYSAPMFFMSPTVMFCSTGYGSGFGKTADVTKAPVVYAKTYATPADYVYYTRIAPDANGEAYVVAAGAVFAQLYKTTDGVRFTPLGAPVFAKDAAPMPDVGGMPAQGANVLHAMRLHDAGTNTSAICFMYGAYLYVSYNEGSTWNRTQQIYSNWSARQRWAFADGAVGYLQYWEGANRVFKKIKITSANQISVYSMSGGPLNTSTIQATTARLMITDTETYLVDNSEYYATATDFDVYKIDEAANSYTAIPAPPYGRRLSAKYVAGGKLRALVTPNTDGWIKDSELHEYEYDSATQTWAFVAQYATAFPVQLSYYYQVVDVGSAVMPIVVDGQLWIYVVGDHRRTYEIHALKDDRFIAFATVDTAPFLSEQAGDYPFSAFHWPAIEQWGDTVVVTTAAVDDDAIIATLPAKKVDVAIEWETAELDENAYEFAADGNTVVGCGWWYDDGKIVTSHDGGKTWAYTTIANGTAYALNALGNGVFIGCGEQKIDGNWRPVAFKSVDNGDTWSTHVLVESSDYWWINSIAYNGSVYIVADFRGSSVYISADFVTWTKVVVASGVSNTIGVVVSVGSRFVVYPYSVVSSIDDVPLPEGQWYSDDNGSTWTFVPSTLRQVYANVIDGVIYVFDDWNNLLLRSTDGGISHSVVLDLNQYPSDYYGPGFSTFIAKCKQGFFMFDRDSYALLKSSDGVTWQRIVTSSRIYPPGQAAVAGVNDYILRGNSNGLGVEYGPKLVPPFWTGFINCEDV